jgi:hypothetical protein
MDALLSMRKPPLLPHVRPASTVEDALDHRHG